jgi:hypothetical protein
MQERKLGQEKPKSYLIICQNKIHDPSVKIIGNIIIDSQ